MTHTVSQLMSTAPTQHAALRFEPV